MIEKAFNDWWDSDIDTTDNPFSEGTPVFWAYEGWKARQANPPDGYKLVQTVLLKRCSASLGAFVSDEGWRQIDMDVMDSVDSLLAAPGKDKS